MTNRITLILVFVILVFVIYQVINTDQTNSEITNSEITNEAIVLANEIANLQMEGGNLELIEEKKYELQELAIQYINNGNRINICTEYPFNVVAYGYVEPAED